SFNNIEVHAAGEMAYAKFKYHIAVQMKSRQVDGEGLGTAVLVKAADGWKIQHLHTSRIPKRHKEEASKKKGMKL
ncbi:MAG: hypothetical protein D6814_10300, partial [Calditrichaeota bacterium]